MAWQVCAVEDAKEALSFEAEVFKGLDHQRRRDILRYVGEGKHPSFTDILNAIRSPDSPILAYRLKTLAPFLEQKEGRYDLTPIGKAAYTLLLRRTVTYIRMALLHKRKSEVIIGHIVLWINAIAAGLVLGVESFMTTSALPSLAGVSLITSHQLFE